MFQAGFGRTDDLRHHCARKGLLVRLHAGIRFRPAVAACVLCVPAWLAMQGAGLADQIRPDSLRIGLTASDRRDQIMSLLTTTWWLLLLIRLMVMFLWMARRSLMLQGDPPDMHHR